MTRVRSASSADIPTIRAIALATWPVAYRTILSQEQLEYMLDLMYSEHALQDQMTAKRHRFLLACVHDAVIGFAGYEHGFRAGRSRLHKLYVLPGSQRSGAGNELLRAVETAAQRAGDTLLELNVNRFNPAREWYTKRGFIIDRDEVIDIGHGYVMDDHVMVKRLTQRTDEDLEGEGKVPIGAINGPEDE